MKIGFVGELISKFATAKGVEAFFERRDAEETPLGVGDGLDKGGFVVVLGSVFFEDAGDVGLVDSDVVGR